MGNDDSDDRIDQLRARVAQLEQQVPDGPTRRQVLAGGGLLGLGGLLGGGATEQVRAQQAAGQVGTESEPMDVYGATGEFGSVKAEEAQTKRTPVVNVKAWGAKGDGTTNDTQAIRDALSYLKSSGGGCLFFPAGTFIVGVGDASESITFDLRDKPNLEITGVGYASHIKVEDGIASDTEYGVTIFQGGANAHIHNLRVDGNRANQGTITDAIDGANFVQLGENSHMHDVWSVNSPGDGVEPFGDGINVHDCTFRNNEEQDVHVWGNNTTVKDNLCIGCQEDGSIRVYTTDTKGGDVTGFVCKDNVIVNPVTSGIEIQQEAALTIDPVIEGNVIIGAGEHGLFIRTATRPRIRDNTVLNPSTHGILVDLWTLQTGTSSPRIERNDVRGATQGIRVYDVPDTRIKQNTVEMCDEHGISYTSVNAKDRLEIKDNDVRDNNQASATYHGINIFDNADISTVVLDDNAVISTTTPNHAVGINVGGGQGSINSIELINSRVEGVSTTRYNLSGTVHRVLDNVPRVQLDVRTISSPTFGDCAYHDGSGTNQAGDAQFIEGSWTSLVDGSTIL